MNKHKPLTALVAAAALALVVSGCESDAGDASASTGGSQAGGVDTSKCPPDATKPLGEGEALKVGTVWPLSGPYAVIGGPIVQGIETYFAKVNAEGGVDGHKLELEAKDGGIL